MTIIRKPLITDRSLEMYNPLPETVKKFQAWKYRRDITLAYEDASNKHESLPFFRKILRRLPEKPSEAYNGITEMLDALSDVADTLIKELDMLVTLLPDEYIKASILPPTTGTDEAIVIDIHMEPSIDDEERAVSPSERLDMRMHIRPDGTITNSLANEYIYNKWHMWDADCTDRYDRIVENLAALECHLGINPSKSYFVDYAKWGRSIMSEREQSWGLKAEQHLMRKIKLMFTEESFQSLSPEQRSKMKKIQAMRFLLDQEVPSIYHRVCLGEKYPELTSIENLMENMKEKIRRRPVPGEEDIADVYTRTKNKEESIFDDSLRNADGSLKLSAAEDKMKGYGYYDGNFSEKFCNILDVTMRTAKGLYESGYRGFNKLLVDMIAADNLVSEKEKKFMSTVVDGIRKSYFIKEALGLPKDFILSTDPISYLKAKERRNKESKYEQIGIRGRERTEPDGMQIPGPHVQQAEKDYGKAEDIETVYASLCAEIGNDSPLNSIEVLNMRETRLVEAEIKTRHGIRTAWLDTETGRFTLSSYDENLRHIPVLSYDPSKKEGERIEKLNIPNIELSTAVKMHQ